MLFRKGDRVRYVSGRFSSDLSNPLYSDFETEGTVVGISHYVGLNIKVLWDNEIGNNYSPEDLELVKPYKSIIEKNYVI